MAGGELKDVTKGVYQMYVEKITIKNFRCFAEATVDLNYPGREPRRGHKLPDRFKNVTLFIGANGSGKTTVFKALCLAVLAPVIRNSGMLADFFVRRPSGYAEDIGNNSDPFPLANSDITVDLKLSEVDTEKVPLPKTRTIGQAVIHRQGDFEDITTAHTNPAVWNRIYKNDVPAFFLAAYGANRRSANPEGYTERTRSPRYERIASIFEEYAALVPFTVGYLQLDKRNLLGAARHILNRLLPDGVTLSNSTDRANRPLFSAFGVLHPFSALSDGYRGFIAWVWDLLVQMARVIPPHAGANAFKQLRGVVIVDEIDLFLHPRWQRGLIEELAEEFPNLQFLFSTHSPLVVGMLEMENIRVLTRFGDTSEIEQYQEEVEGKTPNELLTSIYFGLSSTRSPHSGTLSEQAEKEMKAEGVPALPEERRLGQFSEAQKRELNRMMAQSREYGKAIHKAEVLEKE